MVQPVQNTEAAHDQYGDYVLLRAKTNTPLISVVLSCKNGAQHIAEAINSITTQTFSDMELIIINDGSEDETLDIIRAASELDPRICLISQNNLGLTKSLNRGLQHARGKYVARQDADDSSHPDRLQTQLDFLQRHPNILAVGTSAMHINANGTSRQNASILPLSPKSVKRALRWRNCLIHGSVMINRSLAGSELFYNDEFMQAQDYELWRRLSQRGAIANLHHPLYFLRFSPDSVSSKFALSQAIYAVLAQLTPQQRSHRMHYAQSPCKIMSDRFFSWKLLTHLIWTDQTRFASSVFAPRSLCNYIAQIENYFKCLRHSKIFIKSLLKIWRKI